MTVYISTGGFFNETTDLVIKNFQKHGIVNVELSGGCLLYTSPSPRD